MQPLYTWLGKRVRWCAPNFWRVYVYKRIDLVCIYRSHAGQPAQRTPRAKNLARCTDAKLVPVFFCFSRPVHDVRFRRLQAAVRVQKRICTHPRVCSLGATYIRSVEVPRDLPHSALQLTFICKLFCCFFHCSEVAAQRGRR